MATASLLLKSRILISAFLTASIISLLLMAPSSPFNSNDSQVLGSSGYGYGYGWPSVPPPPSIPEPIPVPPIDTGTADLAGKIDTEGVMTEAISLTSSDGTATAEIPSGTTALDSEGNPLSEITVQPPATEAPVPPATNVIVMADFGPDGATFDPPITITMTFDPASLPEGVLPEDVVIAYYDAVTDEWIELADIVVDTENNTVSGTTSHFTQFAILAEAEVTPTPTETPTPTPTVVPTPTETPTPTPTVVPTPTIEPTPTVTPEPIETPTATVTPEPTDVPTTEPTPTESPTPTEIPEDEDDDGINPWIIIGPVIGVLLIIVLVYLRKKQIKR